MSFRSYNQYVNELFSNSCGKSVESLMIKQLFFKVYKNIYLFNTIYLKLLKKPYNINMDFMGFKKQYHRDFVWYVSDIIYTLLSDKSWLTNNYFVNHEGVIFLFNQKRILQNSKNDQSDSESDSDSSLIIILELV